jgi:hypothetical protein
MSVCFRNGVAYVFLSLRYDAMSLHNRFRTFRDNLIFSLNEAGNLQQE